MSRPPKDKNKLLYKRLPNNESDTNEYKFNYLYYKYKEFVERVCKRHIKNHSEEDCKDVANNMWIDIWRNIHKVDFNHPYLKNYVMRSAMFKGLQFNNTKSNYIYLGIDSEKICFDDIIEEDDDDLNIFDYILFRNGIGVVNEEFKDEGQKRIDTILKRFLTDEELKVWDLTINQGYLNKDVAKLTKINIRQLPGIMSRIRQQLKGNWDEILRLYNI